MQSGHNLLISDVFSDLVTLVQFNKRACAIFDKTLDKFHVQSSKKHL